MADEVDKPTADAAYSAWVAENPTCCEYCFDQWLSDQAHAKEDG